jgi:hypothetical protein
VRVPRLERPGWQASRPLPSGERPVGAEIPWILLLPVLQAED